jgi:hypothetical protein
MDIQETQPDINTRVMRRNLFAIWSDISGYKSIPNWPPRSSVNE